jgi:hypothetical protein
MVRVSRATALGRALEGAVAVLLIALIFRNAPAIAMLAALLPLWLMVASLIAYVGARHPAREGVRGQPAIPLRFAGPMGRFSLRRRGDGRHVEVLATGTVVAEVRATDLRDEIDFHVLVAPDEAADLGSAVGQAMEMVSAADEAHLDWDDHAAPPRDSGGDQQRQHGW